MTRPDLEALARKWIGEPDEMTSDICATEQDVIDLVSRVARHERARIAKALRAACDRHFESIRIWKLRELADELEADHGQRRGVLP